MTRGRKNIIIKENLISHEKIMLMWHMDLASKMLILQASYSRVQLQMLIILSFYLLQGVVGGV